MADKKEYIERGTLLRDVDETVLFSVRGGTETPTPEMRGARKVIGRIEAVPAADVVEVVRCGECAKYQIIKTQTCTIAGCRRTGFTSCNPDDYCSYGKRKGGAE